MNEHQEERSHPEQEQKSPSGLHILQKELLSRNETHLYCITNVFFFQINITLFDINTKKVYKFIFNNSIIIHVLIKELCVEMLF